jgi:hypothetical protein
VCATRTGRPDASTSAALPTALSGEEASTVSVNAFPVIVALTTGRAGKLAPPDGAVGLPPHPGSITPSAARRRGMTGLLTELTTGLAAGFHFEALHH